MHTYNKKKKSTHPWTTKLKEKHDYFLCQGATGGIYVPLILILTQKRASSSSDCAMSLISLPSLSLVSLCSLSPPRWLKPRPSLGVKSGCPVEKQTLLQNITKSLRSLQNLLPRRELKSGRRKDVEMGNRGRKLRQEAPTYWYTCLNPILFFFYSDEEHFSLTKHFPAYLQIGGGDAAQAGTWEMERMQQRIQSR